MDKITLKSDGMLIHNGKSVESDDCLVCLAFELDLAFDFTLRSYFQMLEKYPLFTKLNSFFPTYLERYRNSPENYCLYDGIDYLEFGKTVEMIGFPGKPRLEVYNVFKGVCGEKSSEIRSIHIENLLDMPVKLGGLKHIVFGDKVDIFDFDTVFNLFEFIDGIAWELSFHATPVQCKLRR